MRRAVNQIFTLAAAAIVMAGCGKVGDAPEAKTDSAVTIPDAPAGAQTWAIDTSKSKVSWVGAKITASHEGGFRKFDGTVSVNGDQVTGAKLNVDASSIYTDSEKLAGHLKSDDFFSVEKFPTATFEASQITKADGTPGATHMVTGNLTMRGKTNSVTFPATIQMTPAGVNAKADFKINRKQWDIVYPGAPDDLISDEVRIIFDITANKPAA